MNRKSVEMGMPDLEERFSVSRPALVAFRTSTGRIAVQCTHLKPKKVNGEWLPPKKKPLPPGAVRLGTTFGHTFRDVRRAAKARFGAAS